VKIGFIGTGHLTEAIVHGLFRLDSARPDSVLISPRNTERARRLSEQFEPIVDIALDNQAVVDGSEIVCLAVRPQAAEAILAPLRFSTRHTVISFMAMLPLRRVQHLVVPAGRVVRAATLPYAAHAVGPSILFPGGGDAEALLRKIGTPVVTRDERELELLWVITAMMAPYFNLIEEITCWASEQGMSRKVAGNFTVSMIKSLTMLCDDYQDAEFGKLVANAQTEGGINQQALELIREAGGFECFTDALEQIRIRLGV
tara:strand:+ start:233 stop:1006 length:774 start_codon:yes stop_codon:yes gene_type:complete